MQLFGSPIQERMLMRLKRSKREVQDGSAVAGPSRITVGHEHMMVPAPTLARCHSVQEEPSCVVARFIKSLTTWTVSILIATIVLTYLSLLDLIAYRYFVLLRALMLLDILFLLIAHSFGTHYTLTLFLLHHCISLSVICTRPSRSVCLCVRVV